MEINPIEGLKDFGQPANEPFAIDYRLTTKCNYNCWYCKDLHDNSNKFRKFTLKDYYKLGYFLAGIDGPKTVFLYGGEPSVHPQFVDVVKFLNDCMTNADFLEVQTNLSLPLSMVKKLKDCDRTRWLVSYHHGQVKDDIAFFKKINYLNDIRRLSNVYFMYQKKYKDGILQLYSLTRKMGIPTELLPLLCGSVHEYDDNPYEDIDDFWNNNNLRYITKHEYISRNNLRARLFNGGELWTCPLELWALRHNTFKGMMCNVSRERIIIDHDGGCYKCFNEIFEDNIEPQFNVFKDENPKDYIKSLKPMKCPFDKCFFEFTHNKWSIVE